MESEVNIEAPPVNQLYNPYTEALVLTRHTDIVRLLLQLDIHRCISAGEDGLVIIWDVKTGLVVHILQGHNRPITCMLVLDRPGEKMLLTAASDRQICVWNTDTGQNIQTITEHDSTVKCLVQLPNAEVFCSGGEKLVLWNDQGRLLHSITRHGQQADIHLMITIKNDRIITASDKDIVAYGIVSCSTDSLEAHNKEIRLVKNVPHNREPIRSLVNISDSCFASGSLDGAIILWSTQTLTPSRIFNSVQDYMGESKLYPYSVQSLFVLDERFLFGAIGCGFCCYDITSGTMVVNKRNAHYSKVLNLGFVMDGLFLASCSEDCSIRLWGLIPDIDSTKTHSTELKDMLTESQTIDTMKNFTGISGDQLKLYKGQPFSPPMVGELLGHSGAVQMFVDYGKSGLFSCGVDGIIIAWKNAVVQSLERDGIIRNQQFE